MLRFGLFVFFLWLCFSMQAIRIVSLVPSVTYNLQMLDADTDIVGRTSYCPGIKADQSNVVGSVIDVNIEKIVSLKPDVVFAMELTNKDVVNSLKRLGLKVVQYGTPRNFEEICTQLEDMGRIIGKSAMAQAITKAERLKVKELMARVKPGNPMKVFFEIGAKPLFGVIPGTFMDDYITMAGGQNIIKEVKGGAVSREFVIQQKPDVIIITDMGLVGSEEARQWKAFKQLPAVKGNRIIIVSADESCCPTPYFFTKTLAYLIETLY